MIVQTDADPIFGIGLGIALVVIAGVVAWVVLRNKDET